MFVLVLRSVPNQMPSNTRSAMAFLFLCSLFVFNGLNMMHSPNSANGSLHA